MLTSAQISVGEKEDSQDSNDSADESLYYGPKSQDASGSQLEGEAKGDENEDEHGDKSDRGTSNDDGDDEGTIAYWQAKAKDGVKVCLLVDILGLLLKVW